MNYKRKRTEELRQKAISEASNFVRLGIEYKTTAYQDAMYALTCVLENAIFKHLIEAEE